jgi:Skp family chaperone for outer membrane proteins
VKRLFTRLAAVVAVGAALGLAPAVHAQGSGGSGGGAAATSQRICIVNIASVLRDYDKANAQGEEITKLRAEYVGRVNVLRDKLAAIQAQYQKAADPQAKKKLENDAKEIQRQIQDIDGEAQEKLTKMSNDTIVRVYQEIKGVITDIAKTNSLAMVLCYPGPSKVADETNPAVAQLMLQTPALIPFYHSGMDITHVVLETLNKRYPAPAGYDKTRSAVPVGGMTPMTPAPKPGM